MIETTYQKQHRNTIFIRTNGVFSRNRLIKDNFNLEFEF